MTATRLRQELLDALARHIEGHGFKLLKRLDALVRREGGIRHIYQLRFIPRGPGYLVSPAVAIRMDEVEEIFHRTSGVEHRYQKDSPTIGAEVGNLLGAPARYEYPLHSEADHERVVTALGEVFETVAIPYFASYSSLEAIDTLLNQEPGRDSVHRGLPFLRAATGLIVARLTGRREFEQLVGIYWQSVHRASGDFYKPQFDALIKDLLASSPARRVL